VTWLKRQLKEAQNIIVQLREAQRLAGEGHTEYPGEGGEQLNKKSIWLSPSHKKRNLNERHCPSRQFLSDTHPLKTSHHFGNGHGNHTVICCAQLPANRHVTGGETNIADNRFWADTCS
jgi:hypothetical protein